MDHLTTFPQPFWGVSPETYIAVGLLLMMIPSGFWLIYALQVSDARIEGKATVEFQLPTSHKVLLVASMAVMGYYGLKSHPNLVNFFQIIAVVLVVLLPFSVTVLTIRQLASGKL